MFQLLSADKANLPVVDIKDGLNKIAIKIEKTNWKKMFWYDIMVKD